MLWNPAADSTTDWKDWLADCFSPRVCITINCPLLTYSQWRNTVRLFLNNFHLWTRPDVVHSLRRQGTNQNMGVYTVVGSFALLSPLYFSCLMRHVWHRGTRGLRMSGFLAVAPYIPIIMLIWKLIFDTRKTDTTTTRGKDGQGSLLQHINNRGCWTRVRS